MISLRDMLAGQPTFDPADAMSHSAHLDKLIKELTDYLNGAFDALAIASPEADRDYEIPLKLPQIVQLYRAAVLWQNLLRLLPAGAIHIRGYEQSFVCSVSVGDNNEVYDSNLDTAIEILASMRGVALASLPDAPPTPRDATPTKTAKRPSKKKHPEV